MAGVLNKISDLTKKYVSNAMELIHAPENKDKFLSLLKNSLDTQNNGDALADVVLQLDNQLTTVAKNQGVQIGNDTRLEALPYLVDQVLEVASGYKLIPEVDEKSMRMLISTIVIKFIEKSLQDGTLTQEEMAQAGAQLKQEQARQGTAPPSADEETPEETQAPNEEVE